MKLCKLVSLFLAVLLLVGTMMVPVSAKTTVIDRIEYENDILLSAFWHPHVANKKNCKLSLSTDVPYPSSTKSVCFDYDTTQAGWNINYFSFMEPDKVPYGQYITFMAKAEPAFTMNFGLVQKDKGYYYNQQITTEWQRYTIPVNQLLRNGTSITSAFKKEVLWISDVVMAVRPDMFGGAATGKFWVDDVVFVDEGDIAGLPKVEKVITTTQKPTSTTKAPAGGNTTTKAPVSGNTTTKAPVSDNTTTGTSGDDVTTLDGDVTTTTAVDGIVDQPAATLEVRDPLIKLEGDTLTVPNGMTVSNVLSRLRADAGCELAILENDVVLDKDELISSGMTVTVSSAGTVLASYTLKLDGVEDGADDADNKVEDKAPNNGWVLPVCIVAGVLVIAAVLLIVFRKKIFKK